MSKKTYGLTDEQVSLVLIEIELCKVRDRINGAIKSANMGKVNFLMENIAEAKEALNTVNHLMDRLDTPR